MQELQAIHLPFTLLLFFMYAEAQVVELIAQHQHLRREAMAAALDQIRLRIGWIRVELLPQPVELAVKTELAAQAVVARERPVFLVMAETAAEILQVQAKTERMLLGMGLAAALEVAVVEEGAGPKDIFASFTGAQTKC